MMRMTLKGRWKYTLVNDLQQAYVLHIRKVDAIFCFLFGSPRYIDLESSQFQLLRFTMVPL